MSSEEGSVGEATNLLRTLEDDQMSVESSVHYPPINKHMHKEPYETQSELCSPSTQDSTKHDDMLSAR